MKAVNFMKSNTSNENYKPDMKFLAVSYKLDILRSNPRFFMIGGLVVREPS